MDEELGGLTEDDYVLPPVKYECEYFSCEMKKFCEVKTQQWVMYLFCVKFEFS